VRHDHSSDAVYVGIRSRTELNLAERRVLGLRLRESAGEKRVTAVRPNPPRKLAVEMLARGSGGARRGIGSCTLVSATVDKTARNLACWRVARNTFLTVVGCVHNGASAG